MLHNDNDASNADLSNYTQSIFLPFVYPYKTEEVPLVKTTVNGVPIKMPVDTGSTGLLVGAPILPDVDLSKGTPAHQYLSSSNIFYKGRLVDLSVTFHGVNGSHASATIPVLVVEESFICPWYDPNKHGPECPLGPGGEAPRRRNTSQITYMGVGFGRNRAGDNQPRGLPKGNAFLNIESINGEAVPPGSLRAGYVLSATGVHVGLTRENVRGVDFIDLEPGVTHKQDPRDWAMPRTCFAIDGREQHGYALVDSGIPHMYIRTEEGVSVPNITIRNPNQNRGAEFVKRVRAGTEIAIGFPSLDDSKAVGYTFVVGRNSSMAPSHVIPERQAPPPFVNTGRNFLFGYSIAFDAVGGRFGFRPVNPSSSL
ncbi:hypothetical protein BU26DRAFT_418527 [Trematosphaeria pertusa]|uniref:Peptidase A1 domain-containing protein n=1 Tax=Trematosphaeria pertusa TaxID=390896 RepID=A0A6A6ITK7_9PLEO|nr:uncharacterized protein BU26DRAFT_418527 [Trematosphaeria pertusa]KAF2253736.1 hypothetical protein BU26DRAFT_418527 [Trematosphaeria pertusa]